MLSISKIVALILTVIISYLNSVIFKTDVLEENLSYPGQYPLVESTISAQNIFLIPVTEINLKIKLIPGRIDKIPQKMNIHWGARTGSLICKSQIYPFSIENFDPNFITDIFGNPDISYPFTFFW
jgi:hypothetical protein